MKKKFIKWFNNSRVMSYLLVSMSHKKFWKGAQRLRICEDCNRLTKDIHWSRVDIEVDGRIFFSHEYLCDYCFYHFGRNDDFETV